MWSIIPLSIIITWELVRSRFLSTTTDICNQNLYFNKISIFLCTLKSDKHWYKAFETKKQVEQGDLFVRQRPKMVDKANMVVGSVYKDCVHSWLLLRVICTWPCILIACQWSFSTSENSEMSLGKKTENYLIFKSLPTKSSGRVTCGSGKNSFQKPWGF